LSKEILNLLEATKKTPRYLQVLAQRRQSPLFVLTLFERITGCVNNLTICLYRVRIIICKYYSFKQVSKQLHV